MRHSYRPAIPPKPQPSRTQVFDHLGLVAGMFEELGITEVMDQATQQAPARRLGTAGHAVQARVRNGLGVLNQPRYLVPHFFQHKPISRLIAPGMQARHRHDETLGRALDTLDAAGLTALCSLMAATAAQRLGLTSTCRPRETTRVHVDGRQNSAEAPDAQGVPITQGQSRDHRPDLNQGMWALVVEPQAGIPVRMTPLRGHRNESQAFGQVVSDHMAPLQPTSSPMYLVAASALQSAENLHKLAETSRKWLTRVPATWREAQEGLAQAQPATMASRRAGYRQAVVRSSSGEVAPRWGLISSEQRQPQAPRPVDTPWRKQSAQEVKTCKPLCRTAVAGAAEAPQALTRFGAGWQTTFLHASPVDPTPHYGKRGRPGPGTQPEQRVYPMAGALASRRTDRRARLDQQRCFLLATNELDEGQ